MAESITDEQIAADKSIVHETLSEYIFRIPNCRCGRLFGLGTRVWACQTAPAIIVACKQCSAGLELPVQWFEERHG